MKPGAALLQGQEPVLSGEAETGAGVLWEQQDHWQRAGPAAEGTEGCQVGSSSLPGFWSCCRVEAQFWLHSCGDGVFFISPFIFKMKPQQLKFPRFMLVFATQKGLGQIFKSFKGFFFFNCEMYKKPFTCPKASALNITHHFYIHIFHTKSWSYRNLK